jgi:hypothetical protein
MGPIYMTSALADGRRHEALQAERRRLTAARRARPARPAGPGMLQRFALRAAGWGQRPAVVSRPAALVPQPQACEPTAS